MELLTGKKCNQQQIISREYKGKSFNQRCETAKKLVRLILMKPKN